MTRIDGFGINYRIFLDMLYLTIFNVRITTIILLIGVGLFFQCQTNRAEKLIPDIRLEKIVREVIKKSTGEILLSDLEPIKEIAGFKVRNLDGLQYMPNLEVLGIASGRFDTFPKLPDLENLKMLRLSGCKISNINGIEKLKNLRELDLGNNKIRNIEPLKNLTNLSKLSIERNEIQDISVLATLPNLELITASDNQITSIPDFGNCNKLKSIYLGTNKICFIDPLASFGNVKNIDLRDNNISDCRWIHGVTDSTYINLLENPVRCPENDPKFDLLVKKELLYVDCVK